MNLLASRKITPLPPPHQTAATACNVVVVYEDRPCGELAVEFCRQLGSSLGNQIDLQYELWRFDVLDLVPARVTATVNANNASVIVFSAWNSLQPSASLREWASSWLHQRSHEDCVLVALLNSGNEAVTSPGSLQKYLADIALLQGIELFIQNITVTGKTPPGASSR